MHWCLGVLALSGTLLLAGCNGSQLPAVTADRDRLQRQVAELQSRVKDLEAQQQALRNAPQELLRQAVEATKKGQLAEAEKLLSEVETKYPASPEAGKVPLERQALNRAKDVKRETDSKSYAEAIAHASNADAPDKAKALLEAYLRQNPDSGYKAEAEQKAAEYSEQARVAAEEAKKPPVEIARVKMDQNSIGEPVLYLSLRNRTNKAVDGFEFGVDLYDNYDRPVYRYRSSSNGNTFNGISQAVLGPGATDDREWTMHGFDLATKYQHLAIHSIHFKDGGVWRP